MKIKQFEIVDRCLYWKEKKLLVVGDLHLGYEGLLNKVGWSFPKTQMGETMRILRKVLKKTGKLKEIILVGDVKHYFGGVLKEEYGDFYTLVELFNKNLLKGGKIIITKGNHDNTLKPIIKNYGNVSLVEFYVNGWVIFFHGAFNQWKKFGKAIFDGKTKIIVNGHFHPAIKVKEDHKVEKYKCFALGKYKKKVWLIVPSFFPLVEGTCILDLIKDPKFKKRYGVTSFEAYILSGKFGEVYGFGKVPI